MNRKNLSKRIVPLIVFIFLLNFIASKFYWYSTIWYFDMPMHFLGGIWLGLVFSYIFLSCALTLRTILFIILGVLIVGLGWETFELIFVNYIAVNPFNLVDTISDVCFDLAGGLTALVYCWNVFPRSTPFVETTI